MCIDVSNATRIDCKVFYKPEDFIIFSNPRLGQVGKIIDHRASIPQRPHRHFADNEGMNKDTFVLKQRFKFRKSAPQVVDPYR